MRRFQLAVILAAVLAVGALAACGGSAGTMPTPSGTASPSSAASAALDAKADQLLKQAAHDILVGVQLWAVQRHPAHYPARATAAGVGQYMLVPWPANPFTGAAMKPGRGRGDYRYDVAADRKSCRVSVRLSDGSRFATPVMRFE